MIDQKLVARRDVKTTAVTWFFVMLDAIQAGDLADARVAKRSLRDIGVDVSVDHSHYLACEEVDRA